MSVIDPEERDAALVPDYAGMLRLDGKVFVVLGGGFGIGYQISRALASVGAKVVCVDREPERAATVAAEIDGVPYSGDITDRDTVAALFAFVGTELGRLDGVVDVVGLARYKPLIDLTDDDWGFHTDIVLKHAYLALEYSTRYWRQTGTGGTVAFVASVAGIDSSPNLAAYGATKAAMMSLVRSAAVELGPYGIRVNAVAPGIIRTPRAQANPKWTKELLDENIANTPLGRLAYPDDIAAALLFLSTPLSAHITGQSLVVDGGNNIVFNVVSPAP
jgi:NAD(P)-dependent dehydrogenase (short-subunit alcohol dehydrogenase family)